MTPAQLKAEIESGPLAASLAASWAAGNDTETARLLNVRDRPGLVPLEELAAYCLAAGITGGVQALDSLPIGTVISAGPPEVVMTLQLKGMLKTVMTLMVTDFRLTYADVLAPAFGAACDGLIALGIMTADDKAALLALSANRNSRASELGWSVSAGDIGEARNNG